MTARYRCPFCGSFASPSALATRTHVFQRHRGALEIGLRPLETFGTQEEAIAP